MADAEKKKRVLLVDDSEINLKVLSKILEEDYDLLTAENGRLALDMLQSENGIAVVVLDIIMPVMDGYEVLRRMHADPRMSRIPVIVVSTQENDDDKETLALSLGATDYVTKPYKPEIIRHRIANTIFLRDTTSFVSTVLHDTLTGVYSKEYFYLRVEKQLQDSAPGQYDLVCGDIERFKLVNDLFGPKVGDELLVYCADKIREAVGNKGIYGRIGGDVFAALLPHRESFDDEIFKRFTQQINEFPISVNLALSFGVYKIENCNVPVSAMCDRAMIACNSVKGKYDVYCSYYDDKLRQDLLSEQSIINNMKAALEERQFAVYYQPKNELIHDTVSGAEALVRWIHPELGFMPPDMFVPVFEKNGFITELDIYVWETVCRDLRERMDSGAKIVPISVNVSRTDIYNRHLFEILTGLMDKYGIEPKYFHLEITETAYTENPEQLIDVVKRLREYGFIIEMDDFGSGYSSLNMLSHLPLDVLKLDMAFIQNETGKSGSSILSFIIGLAKWMNLEIVAEGVETKEQLEILRDMECTYVQGFYYAKPMPLEEFKVHLARVGVSDPDDMKKLAAELERENPEAAGKGATGRIMLIADDAQMNRTVLSDIFDKYYNIAEAENGKDAFEYACANYKDIEIILLDLIMPVMDGFQALQLLKNDERTRDIPVIVTSQMSRNNEAKALSMGAADFISKPYNHEVALHRVINVTAESKMRLVEREKVLSHEIRSIRYKAEHDALTGLLNKASLETKINELCSRENAPGFGIITLDIDNLKGVNDLFGRDAGDEILRRIATVLESRFGDVIVSARTGDDEFAAALNVKTKEELEENLENLRESIKIFFGETVVNISVGGALFPEHGGDCRTLCECAAAALLSAKRLGKNKYVIFDRNMATPPPDLSRNLSWLLDETSDGIVICDAESYNVLYLNRAAGELAGIDRAACVGRKCYEVFWNNSAPCHHCIPFARLSETYCEHQTFDYGSKAFDIKGKSTEWGGKNARIQIIQFNSKK